MKLKDWAIDKYLTWRTGRTAVERAWDKWQDETIVFRAGTVENVFMNFKHIVEVSPDRIFDMSAPFGWVTVKDFHRKFEYPNRQLGDNAIWMWFRCEKDQWDGRYHINELSGEDRVFVATNNEQDAIMIALRYAG